MSWHTLSRPSCQHNSAHRPWGVEKQRGLRVKGLNCESQSEGTLFTWSTVFRLSEVEVVVWRSASRTEPTRQVPSPARGRVLGTTLRGECVAAGRGNRTHRPLGCKQDERPGGAPTILSVASPLVRGKCTSGGRQYSCRSGPKETVNRGRGCLGYINASCSLQHPQFG